MDLIFLHLILFTVIVWEECNVLKLITFSEWIEIFHGDAQGSILGPLFFNIFLINDDSNLDVVFLKLNKDMSILMKWLNENYFVMNADKCQLLATNHAENVSITIGDEKIEGNKSTKLLGVTIDNKLHFDEHVSNICKKG